MRTPETGAASDKDSKGIDWETWLDENSARLFLYARQQTRSQADAEDVLQNALLQLVRAVECGEFRGQPSQWLSYTLSAIRHLAADEARRRLTRQGYEQNVRPEPSEDDPWLRCELDDELHRRHVEHVLHTLPKNYTEVLILKIWEGLTFSQIAQLTGENMNSITSRYRRALSLFREMLAQNPLPE